MTPGANAQITAEVTTWPGIAVSRGTRGEDSFRYHGREIGHLHGDHAAHLAFPKDEWAQLIGEGRIVPHPVFPDRQGPAARRIEDDEDVRDVLVLLRRNYDRAVVRREARSAA
jgi:hypothetical protein